MRANSERERGECQEFEKGSLLKVTAQRLQQDSVNDFKTQGRKKSQNFRKSPPPADRSVGSSEKTHISAISVMTALDD